MSNNSSSNSDKPSDNPGDRRDRPRCNRGWDALPQDVRTGVLPHTGDIHRVEPAAEGHGSRVTVTLHTEAGRVFVKGMPTDHRRAWAQECEAAVNPHILPLGPRLLWRVTRGGWDLLGFEHLTGRAAEYGPHGGDLPLVADAMTALGELSCPTDVPVQEAVSRWADYLDDPADAACFEGSALLHTDWHHTNVLFTGTAEGTAAVPDLVAARLLDWAGATRGAGWIDPACWVIWLVLAGNSPCDAEQWAAKIPAWSQAEPRDLDLFATAQARRWRDAARRYPNAMSHRLRAATADWAAHRA
ncbi:MULTISPECIES: aminoglycoside phosphotransferase [unclassified Streptomyces]|uniref:aminoglycoside phosphotransferase n=1 Tax=unclassified Streptomyces TaxID=2593676 RepID=UPI002DDB975A|nr:MULTISPECIES: aminoglycoside phosphotransferase [unclassified Streptomyces]WSA94427.1 aminoglycoside phosphotransferase [Streptomyces sp. NBC_01795]WSB78844.1 aminoglycoside phosphotransferase [Streptomyces sp. NBC_01775]WSS12952.1 aminoglycoside phosphotransferase [Streptomyces sp. NBC_01186]WSS41736.1 aminoglycoside phosphotransferase [Streptomyces sp. NBC_01187]